MTDVITRFKLETTQYESALRDATKWMKDVVHQTELAGNDFKEFSNRAIEAARALGQQATGATNAKDKVKELVSSYNEMAKTYNLMSDAMKKSEGGKALAASLEQLQQRVKDAKAEMNATPGILDNLASKFTVNIDAMKLFNVGLQAAKGALDMAKDAFFNNEEQLDEWGRTVQASDSLYQGFLNALNTGDISGYLSNIGNIVQAAREAYDALDALGTYNAFNQINIERTRTNMTESIADFRGGKGTKEGVKAAGDAYKKELADRQRLENEAYIAAVKEMAAKRGANAKDLMDALSGTYGHYQDLKNVQPSGTRTRYIPGLPGQAGRYEEYKVAQNNQERLGEALRHLNDTELQSLQALGAQAQRTGTEIAQVDKQLTRVLNAKQPGETTKSGKSSKTVQTELQQNQAKINTLTQEYVKLGEESTESSRQRQVEIQREIQLLKERNGLLGLRAEQAQGRLTLKTSDFAFGGASGDGLLANPFASDDKSMNIKGSLGLQLDPSVLAEAQKDADSYIDQLIKGAKQTEKAWGMAGQAVQGIGSAFAMIDDPAAKVAGTVMQAIASVALGFAQASVQAGALGPFGWVAWLAAGAAAMANTISTIHSLTGYASGGVIKGNSYSGDNIMGMVDGGGLVGLNAGETVLNKAQTAHLENELTNNQPRAMRVNGRISGHDIVLAADRSLAQEGKGHIVTWK